LSEDEELDKERTCAKIAHVQKEGSGSVTINIAFYTNGDECRHKNVTEILHLY